MRNAMLVAAVAAAAGSAVAQSPLTINVVGVPGAGVTTWSFSGAGSTTAAGTARTNAANTFNAGDTGQFPFGQDTILNTLIQDQVFALTGAATLNVGSDSRAITGIFIDDDGTSADDMGVRLSADLTYAAAAASSWSGSGTVNVDINTFVLGAWSINTTQGQAMFLNNPVLVNFTAVPAPASVALLGVAGLAARRRR